MVELISQASCSRRSWGSNIRLVGLEGSVKISQRLEVTYWGCSVVSHGAAAYHPRGEVVTQVRGHAMHSVECVPADAQGMGFENVRRLRAELSSD